MVSETFRQKQQSEENDDEEFDLVFGTNHPGHGFAYLEKLKHHWIPLTSIPKEGLCRVQELRLNSLEPSEKTMEYRERYAKTALLLFVHCVHWMTYMYMGAIGKV